MAASVLGALSAAALAIGSSGPAAAVISPALLAGFYSPPADALASIAHGCLEEGQFIAERDGNVVTCEAPLGRPERIAARVLMREPFGPSPRAFIRFQAWSRSAGGSTVQVTGWVEIALRSDDRRIVSLAGQRFDERLKSFLARLGGHVALI